MDLNFKKLEAEDVPCISPFFSLRPCLTCDGVVFDSYLWRDYYQAEFAVADGKAVLIRIREDGREYGAMPVCREEDLPHYFRVLEDDFEKRGDGTFSIYGADERSLEVLDLDPARYRIRELTDQADYIYDAQSLRTLAGRKYHKKKNHVNAFLKEYEGRWEYRRMTTADKEEMWEFLRRWRREKGDEVELHLEAEMRGLRDWLDHMEIFAAVAAGICLDGRLEALTIGSYREEERMSIVHVEKANGAVRGLYALINQQFQQREFPDALLVNREDDVGLPGLRRAKESYHPVMRARKYLISRL